MKYSLSQNYNKYGLIAVQFFLWLFITMDGGSEHTWHIQMKWKQIWLMSYISLCIVHSTNAGRTA